MSRKRTHQTMSTSQATLPDGTPVDKAGLETSLKSFVSNVFYGIVVQDDEEIYREIYDKNFSRKVKENANAIPLTFKGFFNLIENLRQRVTDRFVISQTFTSESEDGGITGTIGHTSVTTGVQSGKRVEVSIVAVLQVGIEEGRRVVIAETGVTEISDAGQT